MQMNYIITHPHKYTFQSKKIKKYVESWCEGLVLNLFAGKTRLNANIKEIRVDLSSKFNPDYCMDAYEFLKIYKGKKFDTVILDPPYSYRKSMESYDGHVVSSFRKIKDELNNIVSDDARVISLGYESTGMSMKRGYEKLAIALVNFKGAHHDVIITIERKTIANLSKFIPIIEV